MADDLDDLRNAAIDRCDELAIELVGEPTEVDRKEMRWGSHGKLALDLSRRRGLWYDFSAGEGGDMIDLVRRQLGMSAADAIGWLRDRLGFANTAINVASFRSAASETPDRSFAKNVAKEDDIADRIDKAQACYMGGRKAGAIGEGYFAARGLDYPDPLKLQLRLREVWLRGFDEPRLALLMPFREIGSLRVVGVHKIALDAFVDGRRVKRSAGSILGAAMMLGRPKEGRLAICEGLETGVAVMMGDPGVPVWCLSGASFMAGFGPIAGIEHLTIYADHDEAGRKAASACSRLWREHAVVTVVKPVEVGKDFADIWRRM